MPLRIRMDKLEERCRRRVDMARNQARDSAAFRAVISEVYGNLWTTIGAPASRYFETSTTFTADGSASYAELEGHMETVRMARVLDDGSEIPLREIAPQTETRFKGKTGDAVAYALVDDRLFLYPKPSSGTYTLYYVQQATELSEYADDDIVDVACPAGMSYVIWGVKVVIGDELEANIVTATRERDKWEEEVRVWAANRSPDPKQRPADDTDDVLLRGRPFIPGGWR